MRRILTLTFFIQLLICAQAQFGGVEFTKESGEPFLFEVNGMLVSDSAQATYVLAPMRQGNIFIRFTYGPVERKTWMESDLFVQENSYTTTTFRDIEMMETAGQPIYIDTAIDFSYADSTDFKADLSALDFIQGKNSNCNAPNSGPPFYQVKKEMQAEVFRKDKMKAAKKYVRNNCHSTNSLVELLLEIDLEEARLELALLAYPNLLDKKNTDRILETFYLKKTKVDFRAAIDILN